MSVRLPRAPSPSAAADAAESGSSSSESDDDQAFSDWASDGGAGAPCKSLFDDTVLDGAAAARKHDRDAHGVDVGAIGQRLGAWRVRFRMWASG
jgi:hypothetical protein